MKKIFDMVISIIIIGVAVLSFMEVDYLGRKYFVYGAIIYVLFEYVLKAILKKKEV